MFDITSRLYGNNPEIKDYFDKIKDKRVKRWEKSVTKKIRNAEKKFNYKKEIKKYWRIIKRENR
jgi:hypothetical protein